MMARSPGSQRAVCGEVRSTYTVCSDRTGARFAVVIVFRPQGCNTDSTLSVFHRPVVELHTLGSTYQRYGDRTYRFSRRGPSPGVPSDRWTDSGVLGGPERRTMAGHDQ
jgi:hypothetical protein